ncbi:MAG TPA: DUF4175 family protein [Candidatus Kapabacteria bacterium]|nr:DUF4175 family protein [Candidatus Kapabacteria bacterium]
MNPASLYSELTAKIRRVRRRERTLALQTAVLNALGTILTTWTVALTLEAIGHFDAPTRAIIYWGAVLVSGAAAAFMLARPLTTLVFRPQDDDTIARRVGTRIPEVGDRLVNTLQLYRTLDGRTVAMGYSPELMEASIVSQGEPLRHYDYDIILRREERRRALVLFMASAAVLTGLFLTAGDAYAGAFQRLRQHDVHYSKPAPFVLAIAPGDTKLTRGDSLAITITATGVPPRSVKLYTQVEGSKDFDAVEIRIGADGRFRHTLGGVAATTRYYAAASYVRTAVHTIAVIDRPEIKRLQVSVSAPGRATERLPENTGDVRGMRGATVAVRVETNIEPARATIVQLFPRATFRPVSGSSPVVAQYDTVRLPMKIDGTVASGGFRLQRDGRYYVSLVSRDGLANTAPISYTMSAQTDGPPTITLLQPGEDTTLVAENMLVPTQVQIGDDFGFSRLRLYYRLTASRYGMPWKSFRSIAIPIPSGAATSIDVPYMWDLTGQDMTPEDELEVYFEVADNDRIGGPKTARTKTVVVRFPSLDELLRQADEMQQNATAELDNVLKQAAEARRQMEEVHRELLKQLAQNQSQAGWQQNQKLQDLMRQHEQMEQNLQKTAEQLREMSERLKQAQAISPETLKKYGDLQKLFEKIKDPELRRSMEQMQKAMEQMTPEQVAEAMKNYKFNEEQFRASIERTMKILERMAAEQKVDEMIRRAEELAKQQEKLNQEMAQTKPQNGAKRNELAERQKDLAKDAEAMQQQLKELAEQMRELGQDMPNQEMQDAEQQMQQSDPGEQMDQAAEQMQQGDMQQAQQKGQQAKQSAEAMKQKMQAVKQKMQENSEKQVAQKMKKAMQELLELSKREEEIKKQTDAAQANSPQFRDLAQQQQQAREDLKNTTNDLAELSQKSFAVTPEMGKELGDAMKSMQEATQSLEQRDGQKASEKEGQAMGSLNRAAMMLQNALAQMQKGQQGQQGEGGMGQGMQSFQQRMQEMAAQQQMINMAMGQQGQGQQGDGQGQGQQQGKKGGKQGEGQGEGEGEGGPNGERMRRLQQQQSDVKKSLDQLNREAKESGGTRKNIVGDLERAAREIEEVLRDIRSGAVTSETRQRQDRILSRMLDAIKSTRERDFEKERESKPGTDVVRTSPPGFTLPEPEEIRRAQRDALEGKEAGYTKDYEFMIRKYFESLGRGTN